MTAMDSILLWTGNILILLGAFFAFTGTVGMLRMTDFFSRLHPAGVTDSLGVPLILAGLMLHTGFTLVTGKLLLILLFLLLTSPTACHALAKAAFLSGMTDEEIRHLKGARQGEAVENTAAREAALHEAGQQDGSTRP